MMTITPTPLSALKALTPPPDIAVELEKIDFELPPRSTAQRPNVDLGKE